MKKRKQNTIPLSNTTLKKIITRVTEELQLQEQKKKESDSTVQESIDIQFRDARKVLGEQRDLRIRESLGINEQEVEREIVFPDMPAPEVEVSGGFTNKDRRMVQAIFDTIVGGGANVGGYRGGRKRALPKLGDMSTYNN
tara:strand:+ start:4647 stop:5066 length:420 start_codon:yes stop_codon:yes gene_type:complete